MKKFIFTLEVVQNTKLIYEKEIRKELSDIEARLMEQILILECLEMEISELCRIWQTQMVAGLSALSLQQFNNNFSNLREQQKALQFQIKQINQEKIECQERLIILMTDLKALEKLKEQQHENYKKNMAKEMESEIDEFVSYHRRPAPSIGG